MEGLALGLLREKYRNMRHLIILALATMALASSCAERGCTDPTAANYSETAEIDDGFCCYDGYCSIDCPSSNRTGALCNDGTTSSSTGGGTCSGHDGVSCWYCNCY